VNVDGENAGESGASKSVLSASVPNVEGGEPGPSSSRQGAVEEGGSLSGKDGEGPKSSSNSEAVEEVVQGLTEQGNSWLSYSELMSDSYPTKSKIVYLKAFKAFERYLKSKNQWQANTVPSDLQILNYFYFLRHEMKYAPTTLWSTYARINAVMKRVYGVSLNSYSRVSDILKSYDSGHVVKQAGIFTPQQIEDFVSDPQLSSKYWLVRKVVCLIGYYGGFRNVELKSLKFENCELDCMGYWFSFARAKQRGRVEETTVCIPS
jgi:hypothetical protein